MLKCPEASRVSLVTFGTEAGVIRLSQFEFRVRCAQLRRDLLEVFGILNSIQNEMSESRDSVSAMH